MPGVNHVGGCNCCEEEVDCIDKTLTVEVSADQCGDVLGDAVVTFKDSEGTVLGTCTTDITGQCEFDIPSSGNYTIEVDADGHDSQTRNVSLSCADTTETFTLTPSEFLTCCCDPAPFGSGDVIAFSLPNTLTCTISGIGSFTLTRVDNLCNWVGETSFNSPTRCLSDFQGSQPCDEGSCTVYIRVTYSLGGGTHSVSIDARTNDSDGVSKPCNWNEWHFQPKDTDNANCGIADYNTLATELQEQDCPPVPFIATFSRRTFITAAESTGSPYNCSFALDRSDPFYEVTGDPMEITVTK